MIRSLFASTTLVASLLAAGALLAGPGASSPAFAQGKAADPKKPDPKAAQAPAPVRPSAIDKVNDWGIYAAGAGKAKACYVLAEPKERAPKTLKRDPGYVFITQRPGEGVRNEVSVVMGFDVKPESTPKAEIGSASYLMIAKGGNLWLKNPAQEADFVNALRKSPRLIVKADSLRGNTTTDTYALAGLGAALDRATKECQ
jgi:invasion protein IalB